jgi:hypothetical protein
MTMKKAVILCALLTLSCMFAFGAAIDGKWTVETQGRNGAQIQTLTLQSDGSKLTGTLAGGRGGSVEITEGKIDGANVSFKVVRAGRNGGDQTTTYTGTLTGDDLKLTVARGGGRGRGRGGPRELAFKRAQ